MVRATLLHRPPPPPGALVREELLAVLESGLHGSGTLVAAPAGYGKSVLVSQWCERLDIPAAWISLTSTADGLREFLRYTVAGAQVVLPGSLAATARLVDDGEPNDDNATIVLSNDLVGLAGPIVVVLDDYHVVTSASVHALVWELLSHPSPNAHFVILSRRDPPWSIGSLRAAGHLNELRMDDLRFTAEESATFVGAELGRALDEREKEALEVSTEGWAAGLRLAVHAVRHGAAVESVHGASYLDRGAQEYLIAEVLAGLSDDVLRYLVAASYFDRFSGDLCDAVVNLGESPPRLTGSGFIDWLLHENLFVVPLDDAGTWFRFHHVFRRLLEGWRTSSAAVGDLEEIALHRAAAAVLSEHGMVNEAVRELAMAGDTEQLVTLALDHGTALIDADRWGELATLLHNVPVELFDQEPAPVVLRAWLIGEHGGRHRELGALLAQADELLARTAAGRRNDELRGHVAVLRGTYLHVNTGDFKAALNDGAAAQQLLAGRAGRSLVQAYAVSAIALANTGRYRDARRVLDAATGHPQFVDWPTDPMIWVRPMAAWVEGRVETVERVGRQLTAAGERLEHPTYLAYGHYCLGVAAYERNDLAAADLHLSESIDIDYVVIEVLLHSGAALALTQRAFGHLEESLNTIDTVVRTTLDTRGDLNVPTAEAALALLEFRCGRLASALSWARAAEPDVPQHRYMFFERTPALIEILLASIPDAGRGRQLLDDALRSQYGSFNRPLNVKLLGLAAVDAARRDDTERALITLQSAVERAQQGGLVRSISDLGPELIPLLNRLQVDGPVLDHVGRILAAISPAGSSSDGPATRADTRLTGEPGLTDRELDVLRLLAERYSNKEISRTLLIAPATVKKHTVTLYDKLHVHGRREAVEKARALGYLPE